MTPDYLEYRSMVEIARDRLANNFDFDLKRYQAWVNEIEDEYLYRKFRDIASDPAIGLRDKQEMPVGDWYIWAIVTGRGFGKNHAASIALNHMAEHVFPGKQGLVVGATVKDVRSTIFGGESGLRALARPGFEPEYIEHNAEIRWPNGSRAAVRTGDNPEDIRGLTVPWAYCDELLKWQGGKASWKNIQMCVREGEKPRIIITSTPKRGREWIADILQLPNTIVTRGKTAENYALPDVYHEVQRASLSEKEWMEEAEGEFVTDSGTLWSRAQIEAQRITTTVPIQTFIQGCDRRGIFIDPSAGQRDLAGMILLAQEGDKLWVMDDLTPSQPIRQSLWIEELARHVANYLQPGDIIGVETNGFQGIDDTLQARFPHIQIVPIFHAGKDSGKIPRAEKAQILYEHHKVWHYRVMAELERQMEDFYAVVESKYESPDRADALVLGLNWMNVNPLITGDFLTIPFNVRFDY